MNPFLATLLSRASVREFTGEPIDRETLVTIVGAGMAAPSAANIQPWAFVVVTAKARLLSLCGHLPYAKMLDKAGAAIVVCGLPGKAPRVALRHWVADCSAATENILLAAHSLGLVPSGRRSIPTRNGLPRSGASVPSPGRSSP